MPEQYNIDIADALSKYLRPEIHTAADGSNFPVLCGVPNFLEAAHKAMTDEIKRRNT